ncbi:MAG: serine/threonine protein kinase, partial [Clostridia bacterium]|nr:serine/threonine protein kinase [Clostridia bacterium]
MTMELLTGRSLKEILKEKKSFSPVEMRDIAVQCCDALAYTHGLNIIHRDIKPENIMRGTDGVFKLSDLGLAKIHSPGEDASKDKFSITMDSVGLGTPQYMSPEQAVDAKNCDSRADIYSLGITLYQLATGRLPFVSNDPIELRRMHASEKPPMPSELNAEIDPDFEHIICKCIEKSRSHRYQTPDELLADIDAYIDRAPLPSLASVNTEKVNAAPA